MSVLEQVQLEIVELGDLRRPDLAARWQETYGCSPAADISAPLMRKALAWDIQARVLCGHSAKTLRALKSSTGVRSTSQQVASVGSRLVREWNGATYEVEVLEVGYRWRGETWSSLSAITREITGTKWSGPRFFGLMKRS